jgi:hypothetical protein
MRNFSILTVKYTLLTFIQVETNVRIRTNRRIKNIIPELKA